MQNTFDIYIYLDYIIFIDHKYTIATLIDKYKHLCPIIWDISNADFFFLIKYKLSDTISFRCAKVTSIRLQKLNNLHFQIFQQFWSSVNP